MQIALYLRPSNIRSRAIINALNQGIAQAGHDKVVIVDEHQYSGPAAVDCVVFYGLAGNLIRIFHEYRERGITTVFLDLGYFGRKGEKLPNYHRVAVNAYQPTAYFRRHASPERFALFERAIQPWRSRGEEILVAGMSQKAASIWGLGNATQHAGWLIREVRKYTDRPIAYRPKPSWPDATPIPGTRYATGPLAEELARAHAVVTWRSNVAIDGLIAGVPCFVLGDNPAVTMSGDLANIETPLYPDDRLGFCADLAWSQFSINEMRNGFFWMTLKDQGLL